MKKQVNQDEEEKVSHHADKQKQKVLPYNFFFNRVLQASAQTTVELCNMLEIPDEIQEIIWSVTKSMLSCQPKLLINRHLDQLVMCTIYSVAKISELKQITFNTIINKYGLLFQNKEYVTKIYTQCVTNEIGETADIITFYNQVFLKEMK
jgi:retinoblastoma-like protein 1